jgi:regulator of MON1-CCZ1 complex
MFDRINQYYKEYLLMNNGMNNLSLISTTTHNNNNNNNNLINTNTLNDKQQQLNLLPIVDQYDMHNLLFHFVEDDIWWNLNSKYTISIIIEYFRSLSIRFIPIEHYLYKLLVNALIKSNRLYQLHQYLQYHVLSDSKALACLLLSIQSTYPAANQLALDMLKRLGTAQDEICDVLLSEGLVLSALRFGIQCGLGDDLHPGKFLETAKNLNDEFIFYDVFKYFEERNIRLRNTPIFKSEDNCDIYVRHFTNLFQAKSTSTGLSTKN